MILHSASCAGQLAVGHVVLSAATCWVIMQKRGQSVLLCPVPAAPLTRHRADLMLPPSVVPVPGCGEGALIRCRPVWRKHSRGLVKVASLPQAFISHMQAALRTEILCQHSEDESGRSQPRPYMLSSYKKHKNYMTFS
ncbi:hypothetical protein [Acetobacter thailandicus]|uniref:hypothetical protein n=1 Tax=Acetobacter thailandicus TaxID=1502842 RepID=UPI001BAD03E6|nr:hypothetical protein [Acetobacter thailandicus]MBS0986840.1 hypothetical protein [Acetobacter thailandicus]